MSSERSHDNVYADSSTATGCNKRQVLFDLVLGKRGYEIIAPVARTIKNLITGASVAIWKTCVVVHCSTDMGLVYLEIGWPLFDQYDILPGLQEPVVFHNSMSPQPGFLFDFLCEPAKKAAQDPVKNARFLVTDSDDPEEARKTLQLTLTRETSGISTKVKHSAYLKDPIYMPSRQAACKVSLEPYSHTEITKWLAKLPKNVAVKVLLSETTLDFTCTACENSCLSFNVHHVDTPGDRLTSCDILAKLSGCEPQPGKRSLSARAVLKTLKEKRVVAVHRGRLWPSDQTDWPEMVTVNTPLSLKQALQWFKVGAWGVPNLVFYKDTVSGLGIELSDRGEDELKACVLFFSEKQSMPCFSASVVVEEGSEKQFDVETSETNENDEDEAEDTSDSEQDPFVLRVAGTKRPAAAIGKMKTAAQSSAHDSHNSIVSCCAKKRSKH
ncbi:hypothetical protein [Cacatuid alphaherpesvirus 2]|uniref:DNA polymerase processivity factor n=1 Tax=Cacatuid alphaherpesvirus 2 TaxID=2604840 RepID=A0A5B9RBS6_9ALPH|nr:hypothetical protein QKT46_gp40 [Cacatuid alphaherpesvirus 2]QEG54067.1 hypothetical protein [Cacatuid alphaherpesvirus 2]